MTAATLYETDADFRALIQCWIDNHRCPLPMADYLRERGLEGQAEAAEWAFWEVKQSDAMGYLRPNNYRDRYWWCYVNNKRMDEGWYNPENGIPITLREGFGIVTKAFKFGPEALLWLLDRWAEVKAAGVELPKVEAGVVTN